MLCAPFHCELGPEQKQKGKKRRRNEDCNIYSDSQQPGGIPRWLTGKETTCQCRKHRRCVFSLWLGKIPWRRKWQSTPVSMPGESHGQRSLEGYGPQGLKEPDRAEHKHMCQQPGCISWGCVSSRPECVRSEPSLPLSASSFRAKRSLPELSSDRKRGAGQPLSAGRCAGWVRIH